MKSPFLDEERFFEFLEFEQIGNRSPIPSGVGLRFAYLKTSTEKNNRASTMIALEMKPEDVTVDVFRNEVELKKELLFDLLLLFRLVLLDIF